MSKFSLLKDIWFYLIERRKWWMWIIIIACLLSALVIGFMQTSAIAPFIYPLF